MVIIMFKESDTITDEEEALYEQVALELSAGNIRQGVWLKALADNEGDELKAKAAYTKMRVSQLVNEINKAAQQQTNAIIHSRNAQMAGIKKQLSAKNCALGENKLGSFTLYTPDGACTNFKSIELLMQHFNDNYQ